MAEVQDNAVVCEKEGCKGFCYRDPLKNELLTCVKCSKQYKADEIDRGVNHG